MVLYDLCSIGNLCVSYVSYWICNLFYKSPVNAVTWLVNPIELVLQSYEGIFLRSICSILMLGGAILKHFLVPIGWLNIWRAMEFQWHWHQTLQRKALMPKYPFMMVLIYFRNLTLLGLLLSLFVIMKVWTIFLIYILFLCRMERFFLCHNWGRWSSNRETFPWHVRCKIRFV